MAMTVLMLKSLAIQSRTPGRGAQKKSLSFDIPRRPHQIADALESKHGIVKIEGHHVDPEVGIGGAGGNEGCHRPGLGDPFLKDLAVFFLVIVEQSFPIHWLVKLAFRRINADLPEE